MLYKMSSNELKCIMDDDRSWIDAVNDMHGVRTWWNGDSRTDWADNKRVGTQLPQILM